MTKRDLKIIAATVTIIGIILGALELYFAPTVLADGVTILDSNMFQLIRFIITSIAPLAYIVIDYLESRKRNL